jgi:hypothetical protein
MMYLHICLFGVVISLPFLGESRQRGSPQQKIPGTRREEEVSHEWQGGALVSVSYSYPL